MSRIIEYSPEGVCASKIIIHLEDNLIKFVKIVGGCPGNGEGVSRLCVGKSLDEVIDALSGIDCRGRGTSCPDQLARALIKFREENIVMN